MFWSKTHKEEFENLKCQNLQQQQTVEILKKDLVLTKEKLEKYINYVAGIAKGSISEKFNNFKKEAEGSISTEVGKVVEEKLVGIMSMILNNKEIDKLTKEDHKGKEVAKEVKEKTVIPHPPQPDITPILKNLEKEIKELKTTVQKHETVFSRLTKIETQQDDMNATLEKIMLMFRKFDDSTPDIKID
jgi:hypothetical protein